MGQGMHFLLQVGGSRNLIKIKISRLSRLRLFRVFKERSSKSRSGLGQPLQVGLW